MFIMMLSGVLWLVGDSTMAPGSGYGEGLKPAIPSVLVNNKGISGASSLSYKLAWPATRDAINNNDVVLIQFGHNDSKVLDLTKFCDPGVAPTYAGSYSDNLRDYIQDVRAAGATPILVTPVSRMVFRDDDGDGRREHIRTHGNYPAAVRHIAQDEGIEYIDLELATHILWNYLGEDTTIELFQADSGDRTHFPPDKAWRVSELVLWLLDGGDPYHPPIPSL